MNRSVRNNRFLFLLVPFFFVFQTSNECRAENIKRLVLFETMPVTVILESSNWFRAKLSELGYEQGKNIKIIRLEPKGNRDLARSLLRSTISEGKPDLVVALATIASQVVVEILKETGTPILFFLVDDPVGAGLVKEIGLPTNITGTVNTISRKTKLDLAMRLAGQAVKNRPVRFSYIHSSYPSSISDITDLMEITRNDPNVSFIRHQIPYRSVPAGIPQMLEDTKKAISLLKG